MNEGPRLRELRSLAKEFEERLREVDRQVFINEFRELAALISHAADRAMEGDVFAIGRMVSDERIQAFAAKVISVTAYAEEVVSSAMSEDAQDN